MYKVEAQEMSPEFLTCWKAAGAHLNSQAQGGIQSWLRAHPHPPVLEHLSFRLGNQLFFIRVEDADDNVEGPGSLLGLLSIADGCNGHACILPMKKKFFGGAWVAERAGWGLVDARTGAAVDPVMLITDEKIEMTDWELQEFAVQVVRTQLKKDGFQLIAWQGNPDVDPAIWFVGKSKQPEWVVVRAVRYPLSEASKPANWAGIAAGCAPKSDIGHFAQVAFASTDDPFDPSGANVVPLWRGHGTHVRYKGLESVQ
jgi:hypothetical protein